MRTRAQVSRKLRAASRPGRAGGPGTKAAHQAKLGTLTAVQSSGPAPERAIGAAPPKELAAGCGDGGSGCLVLESVVFIFSS